MSNMDDKKLEATLGSLDICVSLIDMEAKESQYMPNDHVAICQLIDVVKHLKVEIDVLKSNERMEVCVAPDDSHPGLPGTRNVTSHDKTDAYGVRIPSYHKEQL